MKSKEFEKLIIIRLFENEDIFEQLENTCEKHNVKTAVIISGIGQFKFAKLGFFKEKNNYSPEEFNKPLEILSLSGNIIKQNKKYNFHVHAVLSDEKKKAFGGHLIEGKISVTAEIVLLKSSIDIKRKIDNKTGLNLLNLE